MTYIILGSGSDDAFVHGPADQIAVVNDEPPVIDAQILAFARVVLAFASQLNLDLTRAIRLENHREDLLARPETSWLEDGRRR